MTHLRWSILIVSLLAACSDSSGPTVDGGSDAAADQMVADSSGTDTSGDTASSDGPVADTAASDGPVGDTMGPSATIMGAVENIENQMPVGNATVSLLDSPNVTVMSSASGAYSIAAPANQTVYLKVEKAGFVKMIYAVQTSAPASTSVATLVVVTDATVTQVVSDTGYNPLDPTKGGLSVVDVQDGTTVTISATNEGPFTGTQGTFTTGNTATSDEFVAFWNVDVGTTTVNFTGGPGSCMLEVSDPNIRIVADHLTIVVAVCALP